MSTPASRNRQDRPRSIVAPRLRRRRPGLPRLETLEPRTLLATILVTTNVDSIDPSDDALSLREAIEISNGTLPFASLSPAEQGLVNGSLSALAPNTIAFLGIDVRLLSVDSVSDLPQTGRSRLVVAEVAGSLHIRAFDPTGGTIFDEGEPNLGPSSVVADLKLLLGQLLVKPGGPTIDDLNNVIKRAFAISPATLPMKISVNAPLPTITAPVWILGGGLTNPVDQPDVNLGLPYTWIDGQGQAFDGLVIEALNSRVSNLIVTGFGGAGVSIRGADAQGNWLSSSFVGALPDPIQGRYFPSYASLGNGIGVHVAASNNRIGGNTPGLPNVIANNGLGIRIVRPLGTGTLVQGNFILDNAAQGVYIDSSNNTIGEALPGGGNVISGNGAEGVLITGGPDVQGNNLLGNIIGADIGYINSDPPKGVGRRANGREGVLIDNSPKNIVGGGTDAARNVIGGNVGDGIRITGADSSGNRIHGNWIGFNIVNNLVVLILANQNGVVIEAPGNNVGGASTGEGNTISLNRAHGVLITGALASGTSVLGNTIGLNPDRGSDFGNTLDGVHIVGAANALIGGTTEGARNYISGNNHGIVLSGPNTTGSRIEGNFIGTAGDGLTDLGNAVNGVYVIDSPLNTIGGTATGAGNVISGNNRGIVITGVLAKNNAIHGNSIGTDLTGLVVINNEIDGILINGGASFTAIGGTLPGEGNIIAFNAGDGIRIDSGVDNAIRANRIYDNRRRGIWLDPPGDGNKLQVAPALDAAVPNGTRVRIQGTLPAAPGTYALDLFSTPDKGPSANGQIQPYQGRRYLGRTTVTVDATGTFAYDLPTLVNSGEWITATATDAQGNTSQISNAVRVPTTLQFAAATYTVNESDGSIVVTVNRSGGMGGAVSVDYATADGTAVGGTEYTPVSGTLFFLSDDTLPRSFTIPILKTPKIGGTSSFVVLLSDATNGASIGTPSSTTITIVDDDRGFKFSAPAVSANESDGNVTLTVTRPSGVGTASVDYATVNGTAAAGVNYIPKSGTLQFAAGEVSKSIVVSLKGDNTITGPLTFLVDLSNPVGGLIEPPGSVLVTIADADAPGVLAFSTTSNLVQPGATAATVTVRRSSGQGGTVSVAYATGGGTAVAGSDYTTTSGILVFGPGETSKTITIPIHNPPGAAASSNFLVTLSGPAGGATLGSIVTTNVKLQRATGPVGPGTPGTPTGDVTPPTVVSFSPVAGRGGVASIVIGFSEALDPNRAQNITNYGSFVTSFGRDNIPGTRDDSNVAITGASYDPANRTVTLRLASPLNSGLRYTLTINRDATSASGRGLADVAGNLLAGDGRNAGTPYTATIGNTTSAAPTTTPRVTVPTTSRGRTATPVVNRGRISARGVDTLSTVGALPRVTSLASWARRG